MKRELFLEKIDLLTISLEAIYLSNKTTVNTKEIHYLNNDLRNKNYNKIQKFSLLIIYTYKITNIIRGKSVQKVAQNIIKNDQIIERYMIKFSYVYFRNKKFYSNIKSLGTKRLQNQDTTILALYIISEINTSQGIYKLLQFLNK